MNIIGIIVSYLYIGLVIMGAKIFEKKGEEASRKFIHIMLGNWWIIAMHYFTNVWFAMFVPATFVVINYLSYKNGTIKVMEREKQDGLGTVYYAVSLFILAIICFGILNNPYIGLIPVLVMAYGDGLAAVIGKSIKSKKYKLSDTKKSFAGSLTMFLVSFILIAGYFAFVHQNIFWKTPHWATISALMAFTITGIEGVSSKGIDNISVPIAMLVFLLLIG